MDRRSTRISSLKASQAKRSIRNPSERSSSVYLKETCLFAFISRHDIPLLRCSRQVWEGIPLLSPSEWCYFPRWPLASGCGRMAVLNRWLQLAFITQLFEIKLGCRVRVYYLINTFRDEDFIWSSTIRPYTESTIAPYKLKESNAVVEVETK